MQIKTLEGEVTSLRITVKDYRLEIEKLTIKITTLETTIVSLEKMIEELKNRPGGTQIVEKVVEKIVYRDR